MNRLSERTPTRQTIEHGRKSTMLEKIRNFIRDEEAQSAVEYALVIGIVVLGLLTAFYALRGSIRGLITNTADAINAQNIAP